jgi:hypothetical protein
MVQAILAGRKTMTRRVVKPQPFEVKRYGTRLGRVTVSRRSVPAVKLKNGERASPGSPDHIAECPYGPIGDRLWVRETWCRGKDKGLLFRADMNFDWGHTWKPSIFMPRTASRITLEITGIRVERLNEISEEDAIAEGCNHNPYLNVHSRIEFMHLWNKINGIGYWEKNPLVWVIEFKRINSSSNTGSPP